MIRTVLTLTMAPERLDAVLEHFEREQILQKSVDQAGAITTELSVASDGSGTIMVTALWKDQAAYDGWLSNPFRAETNARMAELLEGAVGVGRTFDVRDERRSGPGADPAGDYA